MLQHIAKFNPYNMDDVTVLALATGRRRLLKLTLDTLADNLNADGNQSHLLIYGPRGMGKSFFLKYLSIKFRQDSIFKNCDFISLPEEQSNIKCTTDFIRMVLAAEQKGFEKVTAIWEETEEVWEESLQHLEAYITEKRRQHPSYLLVVVMENLNEFLNKLRGEKKQAKIKESRFRYLLERVNGFLLIGASPREGIDSQYNKRIFKAWKTLSLHRWEEEDYYNYFERRYRLEVSRTGITLSPEQFQLRKNKLRAISKYTGGSPRMAVVLSHLLLEDNAISTAQTMYGLIDDLTPYYQSLTSNIPDRPRQLLDTLIRLGENKSQSEIAKYLETTQNSISRHFLWLRDNGYILGEKRSDSKHFRYYVADRVFVLYYQDREIFHGQEYTPVWLLSDFLVLFYEVYELRKRAAEYVSKNVYWILGQKAVQHFLLNQKEAAWEILANYPHTKEKVFKEFADVIVFTERRKNRAAAFAIGNEILHELKERQIELNYSIALSMFFAGLLNMEISNELFKELCEQAKNIYTARDEQVILSAALHTVQYIMGGKELVYLEKLPPDMAIAVKAIVEQGELK